MKKLKISGLYLGFKCFKDVKYIPKSENNILSSLIYFVSIMMQLISYMNKPIN